ncbi:unnamed protein product [Fusarium equiseti]|uniref:Uncharacterized protein n=1 Tax=Fusarium equiseti TaxID=61235 RepID=A0A8J2IS44_FUSEQ|nr:unnamed protein product [Fusarium equiseti]
MSSRPPSPRGNDTEDQFGRIGDLSSIINADAETLDSIFDGLPPLVDSEDERFLGIESSQVPWSTQATGDSSLEPSQPTHSTPNDTPESSNPAPTHQGVRLVLPNAPTLYNPPASGPGSRENSNEDNALNCEAAETSRTGGFGGGGGIIENGNPFDLCAPPQPEREIGRYYHYNPQDRSFVNYVQEISRLFSSRESPSAAPAASSSDDIPKPPPPPPPAPKKKPSASKESSKSAKRRKTATRSQPRRRFSTIAPRPAGQTTPTATDRSHMPPPPSTPPIAVLGTSRPLNGYSYGRGSVSTQVQFNHRIMNGDMLNNMGHPSMAPNAPFVNGNGNSMYHGTMPQGRLHSVQNHSNDQDINNVNIHRPATPIPDNVNGLQDGFLTSPNAFAPCHPADASRQQDTGSGGDFVPSSPDLHRARRRARAMGTVSFARHDSFSTGGSAAGLYHTSSPSSNPWEHLDRSVPISRRRVTPGSIGWAPRISATSDSPMGNTMGGFSQSSDPGSSPISHMDSSPPDPESMTRREVNGRRGSSSMTLNDLPGANNTVQNDYFYHPYDPR